MYTFIQNNTPSSGRNTKVLLSLEEGGSQIGTGEFESATLDISPELLEYRPMNAQDSESSNIIDVYNGQNCTGTLGRGLVDEEIFLALKNPSKTGYFDVGRCSIPKTFKINIFYCIPKTGKEIVVSLSGVKITNFSVSASGGATTMESINFKANKFDISYI